MSAFILNMTPEQRAEVLGAARMARVEKKERFLREAHLLRKNFADKAYWRKLASKYQVRFPASYVPGTELQLVRKAMKKSGVTPEALKDAVGMDVKKFQQANPSWPAYALIGIILELAEESNVR